MNLFEFENIALFLALLPLVAFFYASVGHGGASGYLALMALFAFPPEAMKPTALLLNIFVAGVAFWSFYKVGYFTWKLFWPFAVSSIPAAFLGGFLEINATLYKQILAVILVVAILRMIGFLGKEREEIQAVNLPQALFFGAGIGFFSGMIGIGGGIILSPVILLMGWGRIKETAAVSALFIFVNSVAGMGGYLSQGAQVNPQVFILVLAALVGGLLGAQMGSKKFNNKTLKYVLASVLLLASVKLFVL